MVHKPWVECIWELPVYIPGAQPKSIVKNSESDPLLSVQKSYEKQKKTYIKIRIIISARILSNSEQRPQIIMKSIMVMMITWNMNTQNEFQFGLILFLNLDLIAVFYQLFYHSNTLTPPERAQNRWVQGDYTMEFGSSALFSGTPWISFLTSAKSFSVSQHRQCLSLPFSCELKSEITHY